MTATPYDPFAPGPAPVRHATVALPDPGRGWSLTCALWYPDTPAPPGGYPLVVYSHPGGGTGRSATFLGTHLAGHGYAVAAPDHSELTAPALRAPDGPASARERDARAAAVAANRVPDLRLVLDHLLAGTVPDLSVDPDRIALAGHSFGGWTVLAAPDSDPRIRAVVAFAPGGSTHPRPGILRAELPMRWGREVPALVLAAADDVMIPLPDVLDVYHRVPAARRLYVLRSADHMHFVDDIAAVHEAIRATPLPGDAAWIPAAMRPAAELCPPPQAHDFVRGLTLAHLDAVLRDDPAAAGFLARDAPAALAARGVDAYRYPE